jgi:hypothetical protein
VASVRHSAGATFICNGADYLGRMFEFCLPTKSTIVPDGPDWLHEVKYAATGSGWSATVTACA